eukprot:10344427-Alexandrium_andersonii.AAC.1
MTGMRAAFPPAPSPSAPVRPSAARMAKGPRRPRAISESHKCAAREQGRSGQFGRCLEQPE